MEKRVKMCGIAGFTRKKSDWEKNIRIMLNTIRHRGPDGEGIWTSQNDDIVLGHRRLSIIDLSNNGSQPMVSMGGKYVISFNGEIYNYKILKEKIQNCLIRPLKSSSDTEVLLESFEILGIEETLKIIKGMFAIALYDCRKKKLYLIRDRLGEKPLYYGYLKNQFVFASDLSAIRQISQNQLGINPVALDDYFKHGYISGEQTIYSGFYTVLPGSLIEINVLTNEIIKKDRYWDYNYYVENSSFNETLDETQEHLEILLKEAIRQQLTTSDVPVGAFLSGGIDSSLVVALGQEVCNGTLNTYSIGFYDEKCNEAHFARRAAEQLGTKHHELYLTEEDAKNEIPKIVEAFSEPFADISELPTLLVSKMAKKDVTVVLSGDGGDEFFGGYTRYIRDCKYWTISKNIPAFLKRIIEWTAEHRLINDERILKRMYMLSSFSAGQLYDRAQWPSVLVSQLLNTEKAIEGFTLRDDIKLYNAFMAKDVGHYLPSDILVKVDRAGMYYSLESRIPMLDRDVAEYAASIPEKYKIQGHKGKIILRNILKKYFPDDFFERKKQGFSLPIGKWVLNDKELNQWANEMLNEHMIKSQGILNSSVVHSYWENYKKGKSNFHFIWRILMFENWYEYCYMKNSE